MPAYRLRKYSVQAWKITEHNLDQIVMVTGGSVKGTKLPMSERVVQWYDPHFGCENEGKVGEWLVRFLGEYPSLTYCQAFPEKLFYSIFREEGETR